MKALFCETPLRRIGALLLAALMIFCTACTEENLPSSAESEKESSINDGTESSSGGDPSSQAVHVPLHI